MIDTVGGIEYRTFHIFLFSDPYLAWNIWFEAPSLLPAKWQCQKSPSEGNYIEKCLISEHFIFPSWEENHTFFHKIHILFLLDNQVNFILNTIIWCKFWRKMFFYLCKYSYKANMWIFTWKSKHKNIFREEKGKKRKNEAINVSKFSFLMIFIQILIEKPSLLLKLCLY